VWQTFLGGLLKDAANGHNSDTTSNKLHSSGDIFMQRERSSGPADYCGLEGNFETIRGSFSSRVPKAAETLTILFQLGSLITGRQLELITFGL
jgi:hypothetical protein